MKFSISLRQLVYVFLTSVFAWIAYTLYQYDLAGNGFIFGDWFVTYQDGGFKRRGLSGNIMFFLQDTTGFSLLSLVYSTQMLLYVIFFYQFYKLLISKKISLLYFTLIISPLTFLIYLNDGAMVGRKEIIFITIFCYYLNLLTKNKLTIGKEVLIYTLLIIATFIHEITVFYIPYFLLAHFLIIRKIDYKRYIVFLLCCGLPAVIIFLFGAKTNEGETLAILASRGVKLEDYSIFSFTNDLNVQLDKYRNNVIGYGLYAVSLVLGVLHFGWFIKSETKLNYKWVITYFLIIFLYTVPLFYLACDWGRWMQIHFVILLLILTTQLKPVQDNFKSIAPFKFLNRNLQYFGLILFLSVWSVKHFNSGLSYDGILTTFFMDLYKLIII
ncbi:MAG: hypothetical protein ACWA5P_13085 [bacterium]